MSGDSAMVSTRASSVIVDELPDGVVVMAASGLLKSANRAFLEMVGRDECEVTEAGPAVA